MSKMKDAILLDEERETNREGLTFDEWMRAANNFHPVVGSTVGRYAWKKGEDPTEYAAQGGKS